jgi:2'-5' RNA ligase
MSEGEMQARLWELRPRFFIESVGIMDQYLFAGIPERSSRDAIVDWLHSLRWERMPKFVPVPQLHMTVRFSYNTLASHIDQMKSVVDNFAKFKENYTIPVEKISLMGRHKTLFGFEFPQNHPTLKWAAKIFDVFVQGISHEPNIFGFRPHMRLAERVQKMPGLEGAPHDVKMHFAIVKGILNEV